MEFLPLPRSQAGWAAAGFLTVFVFLAYYVWGGYDSLLKFYTDELFQAPQSTKLTGALSHLELSAFIPKGFSEAYPRWIFIMIKNNGAEKTKEMMFNTHFDNTNSEDFSQIIPSMDDSDITLMTMFDRSTIIEPIEPNASLIIRVPVAFGKNERPVPQFTINGEEVRLLAPQELPHNDIVALVFSLIETMLIKPWANSIFPIACLIACWYAEAKVTQTIHMKKEPSYNEGYFNIPLFGMQGIKMFFYISALAFWALLGLLLTLMIFTSSCGNVIYKSEVASGLLFIFFGSFALLSYIKKHLKLTLFILGITALFAIFIYSWLIPAEGQPVTKWIMWAVISGGIATLVSSLWIIVSESCFMRNDRGKFQSLCTGNCKLGMMKFLCLERRLNWLKAEQSDEPHHRSALLSLQGVLLIIGVLMLLFFFKSLTNISSGLSPTILLASIVGVLFASGMIFFTNFEEKAPPALHQMLSTSAASIRVSPSPEAPAPADPTKNKSETVYKRRNLLPLLSWSTVSVFITCAMIAAGFYWLVFPGGRVFTTAVAALFAIGTNLLFHPVFERIMKQSFFMETTN